MTLEADSPEISYMSAMSDMSAISVMRGIRVLGGVAPEAKLTMTDRRVISFFIECSVISVIRSCVGHVTG